MICPHCGCDTEILAPALSAILKHLNADVRRDIYEIAGPAGRSGSGRFTISYAGGQSMPEFNLETAQAVARTGIVYQDPECPGWFRRSKKENGDGK